MRNYIKAYALTITIFLVLYAVTIIIFLLIDNYSHGGRPSSFFEEQIILFVALVLLFIRDNFVIFVFIALPYFYFLKKVTNLNLGFALFLGIAVGLANKFTWIIPTDIIYIPIFLTLGLLFGVLLHSFYQRLLNRQQ